MLKKSHMASNAQNHLCHLLQPAIVTSIPLPPPKKNALPSLPKKQACQACLCSCLPSALIFRTKHVLHTGSNLNQCWAHFPGEKSTSSERLSLPKSYTAHRREAILGILLVCQLRLHCHRNGHINKEIHQDTHYLRRHLFIA